MTGTNDVKRLIRDGRSIEFHVATQHHAQALSQLHRLCVAVASHERAWSPDEYRRLFQNPTTLGWIACTPLESEAATEQRGDPPVGFILAVDSGSDWDVLMIGVLPEMRRQGVGSLLLGHLLDKVTERGASGVFLEVACDNVPAHLLYQSLSFKQVGLRREYYKRGDTAQDAVVLRWVPGGFE